MLPQLVFAMLLGADLSGVWTNAPAAPPASLTLTLQQAADTVSGTEQIADRVFPIGNGRVENNRLTFTFPIPLNGRLRQIPAIATLQGDELHLRETGAETVLKRVKPDAEAARIERLSSLIRLWGAIRYFHPYVADQSIDWGAALIATIQPVEKAESTDALTAAISKMLGTLNDPETRILGPDEQAPPPIPCQCRTIVRSGLFNGAPAASAPYYVDWENVAARAPYIMRMPDGIRVAIRTAEPVAGGTDIRTSDNPYIGDLPSRELRLLALARYWNAIHYFYGYPDLLESWDSALAEFIPQFEQAQTRGDYTLAIGRLTLRTHDGHSFLGAGTGPILDGVGDQSRVALLRNIGGQIVVTSTATPELRMGDVVRTIDGQPALTREAFLRTLFPYSTPQSGTVLADRYLLAGPADKQVRVGVRRLDGTEGEIALNRYGSFASDHPLAVVPGAFGRLPSGLGYIDLTRLFSSDVDRAFDELMDAPGLILDLRGAPRNTFLAVAARLTDRPVATALIRQRVWHGPDPAAVTADVSLQHAYPTGKPVYRGRVAVLIDGRSFSQSEHTCLVIEAATRAVFVGMPTSGTDGEVTSVSLPGGVRANFAAMSISHADGRPLQRVGIIPDVWAEPTLKGIQEGRDEILDAAIGVLTGK